MTTRTYIYIHTYKLRAKTSLIHVIEGMQVKELTACYATVLHGYLCFFREPTGNNKNCEIRLREYNHSV